jgi:dihydroorotase
MSPMRETPATLFIGGRLIDPASGIVDEATNVLAREGKVAAIGAEAERAAPAETERIDITGLTISPGFVDLHSHLREPGFEHKETIETGTRSAALGGYTAVAAMANTQPVTDHASVVAEVRERAREAGLCDVFPVGAITAGLEGASLAEIGEMVEAGVRFFSDDHNYVPDAWTMRNALRYARAFDQDVVIADHCEEPSLVQGGHMHEGINSYTLGLTGRPAEAEEIAVARDITLARVTGGRLHVCHVSCAAAVDLIRDAKARGIRVSAEVTPHHLVFTDDDLVGYDTNLKVHPPIRTAEDRSALREGVADGTIDAIATDHAPHAVQEKEAEFDLAPPGTIGFETALAAVLTYLVEPGIVPVERAIAALTEKPARILGASGHGGPVQPGAPANLVVFDPDHEWVVEAPFASKSRNSAFLGHRLKGKVLYTMLRGSLTVAEGKALI